ncbi:MAG: acyltransferase family protein [Acidobacteriota bacterium]
MPKEPLLTPSKRHHDLDALRAFAMLLGIALHAALAFVPLMPWPVQDSQQNELFGLLAGIIHGFRMPVFFVMSGFFTAMLWRGRGLRGLLAHRAQRIALPLLLSLVTVVPAVEWASARALEKAHGEGRIHADLAAEGSAESSASEEETSETPSAPADLHEAVFRGDLEAVRRMLEAGSSPDALNFMGSTPLIVAAAEGRVEAAKLLIEAGAAVNLQSGDGSSALHTAAFFGRSRVARLLVEAGADSTLKNAYGQRPAQTLEADWQTTAAIAAMVGLTVDREEVETGRREISDMLRRQPADESAGGASAEPAAGLSLGRLMLEPFFHHLWFLYFLCWLVPAFALCAALAEGLLGQGRLRDSRFAGWILSPWRVLWLLPLTALPQAFMGRIAPVFGADTSAGLLPMPHVLAYYAVFFFFGAAYFEADDREGRVGRGWKLVLPLAALVLLPGGLALMSPGVRGAGLLSLALSSLVQVAYTWAMIFGLIGLFRRFLSAERPWIRYLSDASYWLYLMHLPLVIEVQALARTAPWPAAVKFVGICLGVTALLLAVYQGAVRTTWLGRLLNGPRPRPA